MEATKAEGTVSGVLTAELLGFITIEQTCVFNHNGLT